MEVVTSVSFVEASFGVRLFDRSGKKIHLTREGVMLLASTSKIIAEMKVGTGLQPAAYVYCKTLSTHD